MLNKLREQNLKLIKKYEAEGGYNLIKQNLICSMLKNDDCFKQLSVEEAYTLLTDLGVKPEELKNVYIKLTTI